MGRKVVLKKIEDNKKRQVTFSKRRSSLIKKANEISVRCDVDVAFVAFSPSGRVSEFCNRERIEDVVGRYANLPTEKRFSHIKNIQEKMEKLHQLGRIRSEEGKLLYLNDQIENLEWQTKKKQLEVQLLEAHLRDYELKFEEDASFHQLSWCEENLQRAIDKLQERKKSLPTYSTPQECYKQKGKMVMESEVGQQLLYNIGGNQLHSAGPIYSSSADLLFQCDPWIFSHYSLPENIFTEVIEKGKGDFGVSGLASQTNIDNNKSNVPMPKPSNAMNQFGTVAPGTQNGECSYAPKEVNFQYAFAQDYPEVNSDCDILDYRSWQQIPNTNFSFVTSAGGSQNMAQNYQPNFQYTFDQVTNGFITHLAESNNSLMMNPIPRNQEDGDDNNTSNKNYMTNDLMSQSQVHPPFGISSDLSDIFPSMNPYGDNAP